MTIRYNTCCWKLGGTKTIRRASTTLLDRWGTNLQNSTNDIKRIYTAPEGHKFVQRDQSGAEALIVAYLCRAGNFRDLFIHGVKPHVYVAMHMFRQVWEQELKQPLEQFISSPIKDLKHITNWQVLDKLIRSSDHWESARRFYFMAKMVCHASNYGITAPMLQMHILQKSSGTIALSLQDAEMFLALYHSLFPEIREWHMETEYIVSQTRRLNNLQGFPMYFGKTFTPKYLKDVIAWVAQSTVGCITQTAVSGMYGKYQVVNDGHDSFMCLAKDEDVEDCSKVMKELIEQELTSPRGEVFRMKSSCSVGSNWGHKDKDNPDGMEEIQ